MKVALARFFLVEETLILSLVGFAEEEFNTIMKEAGDKLVRCS